MSTPESGIGPESLWYKDAVIYEVHVRSYCDGNGDGIGDFQGLLNKLPYLEELGITALWLLPFYPSPLRDDGYDIADYFRINPDYGTLGDFREFLREAHARGIRVITELVLNHTSDQHAWFQKSRRAKPGSPWRNFYVWSDTQDRYRDARIIFKDFESSNWAWDPLAKAYYWHRFYSHQPDLNFENPRVHKALLRVLDFWFSLGVDGLRLDAIPYLYEREGTNCENLPETYAFLKKLRAHMDSRFPDRMLLAEANQWPEDAVAYFGEGDLCHMAFHFPLMPRMFMALQMEDRFPIVDILEQTPQIPDDCQWGLFLRNHDELTLEMVTDEERDYMYRVYARDPRARINLGIRRRLAPLMGNDRRRIELMNALLFALPGTPIIYYGDEIGMGDNYYLGDRNGVRTPMQWSLDRNAGFSSANPQMLFLPVISDPEYHYEAVNVETQARNPSSLLSWMRRIIDLRRKCTPFGRGSIEFLTQLNPKILAFVRRYEGEVILVLINLSRFTQAVEVNTPRFVGYYPEDLFSRNRLPLVKDSPYVFILGGHEYHFLLMKKEAEAYPEREASALPEISVLETWEQVLDGKPLEQLEQGNLPDFLGKRRWFGGKGRTINKVRIREDIPLVESDLTVLLLIIEISYAEGGAEFILLPLHYVAQDVARQIREESPQAVIAVLRVAGEAGILYDALYSRRFRAALFETISSAKRIRVKGGELAGNRSRAFRTLLAGTAATVTSRLLDSEQTNSSFLVENNYYLKMYRRLEEGINPEVEMGKFLTDDVNFEGIAPLVGTLEYRRDGHEALTLAILQGYIPGQGDAWGFALVEIARYFERLLSRKREIGAAPRHATFFDTKSTTIPTILQELIGVFFLEMVALLARRTGELHLALASRPMEPDFSPEPFTTLYQRSVYQSMRSLTRKVIARLGRNLDKLNPMTKAEAEWVVATEQLILKRQHRFLDRKFSAMKIRIHGDFHLGQVLFSGKDFIIIDFEGEPARSMSERRLKRSPLRDVAGMIRSFHYAVFSVLLQQVEVRGDDVQLLEEWAEAWYRNISGVFINSYLATVADASFIPSERQDLEIILNAFMLDKALYELGYELDNRPEWIRIPIRGIRSILRTFSPEPPSGSSERK